MPIFGENRNIVPPATSFAALISPNAHLKTNLYRTLKSAFDFQMSAHSEELPVSDRPGHGALRMMQRCVQAREMDVDDRDRRTEYTISD